ncbi:MAG: hypothetical protein J2P36_06605 [Ktedonobacteraceae bacterium]|nr:hypothetical protein [Ktedonobacteraceae bacterium]
MSIHVFGIRHHGPGCARSLRAALEALQPDIVLVEGPPDAHEVLPLLTHERMKPPVALLIYRPDAPKHAVYYPFTHFSPEWQALGYALQQGIPTRFMDLPQAIRLAQIPAEEVEEIEEEPASEGTSTTEALATPPEAEAQPTEDRQEQMREDPLAMLSEAAGYSDHELWWEHQIEQRQNVGDLFAGILEAMSALRTERQPKDEEEARREAYMRQRIRAAQQEGFQRIAVVCGAWHAPVLVDPGPASEDEETLKKLKSVKVVATWIPWTNSRLSYHSGYGAGVNSPGWYEHLWTVPDRVSIRWIARAAYLLREQDMDASSASAIEAVRLAESLAAIRDLSMPGLAELQESIQTVLCHGNVEPMNLIRDRLEIGERLGEVPTETPMVPLQRDVELWQRRLRLPASTEIRKLELDLRKETDRARSQLLHRLNLLNIPWGKTQRVYGKAGTFHEHWQIQWQVEFVVSLIEANVWGNTMESAAASFVTHTANQSEELSQLTELLDSAILAGLNGAIEQLLRLIQKCAAIASDVRHLMNALPPLAKIARYGDVRGTQAEQVQPIIDGLFERVLIGLPGACSSLDDDAAQTIVQGIDHVQECVQLLDLEEQRTSWQSVLGRLIEQESIHSFVRGRCCRLLLEQNVLSEEELQRLAGLALSPVTPTNQAAAWIEGVLRGGGLAVLHQNGLWRALDRWLLELAPDVFIQLLPILRRAFSGFQSPERRKMGEKVKHLHEVPGQVTLSDSTAEEDNTLHRQRADLVLPVLAQILGATGGTGDGN